MNFKEVFKEAQRGKAIARPHWKQCLFFFWQHERLWKLSRDGKVRLIAWIPEGCYNADDWQVVESARIPVLPLPPPKQGGGAKKSRAPLVDRQAEMRARWS